MACGLKELAEKMGRELAVGYREREGGREGERGREGGREREREREGGRERENY